MAEKILNTRIQLKYDTYENWISANPVLKKGEVAIATLGSTVSTDGSIDKGLPTNPPTVLIKVGDGLLNYSSLQFISAKAADVYPWAKETQAEFETRIKNLISDNATKVEASNINGNIKVDDEELVVYTHPDKHAINDVDGLQDALDGKVASVTAGDNSITIAGSATAPTVATKISASADNAITLEDDGLKVVIPTAAEYTIEKASESGEYAAVYNLKKDGVVVVGSEINIPKDLVVKEGSVVENPVDLPEGTYIKLILQNDEENPLYINVGDLIEYVTSGSNVGDMVVIDVSNDHKVTATITDGTITLAKLATDVTDAIASAEQNGKGYADGLIADLDSSVAATAEVDNKVSVLTGVTQEDGKLTDKSEVTLAAIAKTGSTDDLIQGELVLVFDCGDANDDPLNS